MTPEYLSIDELIRSRKNQEELKKKTSDIIEAGRHSIVISMIDKELTKRGYDILEFYK